ncbi:cytochrome P450 4c3-like [Atheta coriaria]|uniref:cytochrome P450 4c3-like n=1 Tax=Dalotia coriaria TaxID=877792 RepID=UPI0031F44308
MFLLIVCSILIGIVGIWYYNYSYFHGYLKKIPSPKFWPILGNALEFSDTGKFLEKVTGHMNTLKTKSLRVHFATQAIIVTKDYNLIEHVLSSNSLINKGFQYDFFQNWVGLSVFTSSGQQWRSKRKMLTPTFHFQILEDFVDVFNNNAVILANRLKKQVGVKSFDICSYVTLCTLDVICETAMGTSINAQLEESSAYVQAISRMGKIAPMRMINPLLHSDFIYRFSALYREEQELLKIVHGYNSSIIRNRRQAFIEQQKNKQVNQNKQNDDIDVGRKKKIPFLDLLFQTTTTDGQPLTDDEIASEVANLMFAGHDTSSGAMSFALYLLGNNPEAQQKAFEELRDIFGDDKTRHCTLTDINSMKYLELVIKETLRLYPSAPVFTRKIQETFTVDGITYPKGTTIGIFAYGIHRDEEHYKNPEQFEPERFSRENNDGKKPFAFIPFSAGPRNCIGQKFAMLELKTLLSMILRNFEVIPAQPHHKLSLISNIMLKSENGINIALVERKY